MNIINVLFNDRKEVSKLETKCYQQLRHNYPNGVSTYQNIKNGISNIIIYVYIMIMIFYLMNIQLNVFSFILLSQNIVLIGLVAKQEKSLSNLNMQIRLTQSMKLFACFITVIYTIYLSFDDFFDKFLKNKAKKVYENLNFIGLKETDFLNSDSMEK